MLSHNLKNLAAALQMGIDGKSLTERALRTAIGQMRELAEDAARLEACAIAPDVKVAELPDNVVRIATVLVKKGVTTGPRPVGPSGGGDAA